MKKRNFDVLIIEDSPDDLELYRRLLNKIFNCSIEAFAMAESAMAAIKNKKYDVILLDYNLSGMSGLELLQKLKQMSIGLDCPVIVLTGQGNELIAVKFMHLGVTDYIQKSDISLETFSHTVHSAIKDFNLKKLDLEKQVELFRFAHTVAHDLKAPLSRMESYSGLIEKNFPNLDCDYLKNIKEDAQYAIDFLDQLLLYAETGRSSFEKSEVDLDDAVRISVKNLELQIAKSKANVKVMDLPKILGNKISLIQLFQNLISNGIKYSKQNPVIKVYAANMNEHTVVTVEDNGIGIPPKMQKEVFKPFTRLQNELDIDGVGLGLALCQTIAKQHDAKIDIEESKEGGTKINIAFPQNF